MMESTSVKNGNTDPQTVRPALSTSAENVNTKPPMHPPATSTSAENINTSVEDDPAEVYLRQRLSEQLKKIKIEPGLAYLTVSDTQQEFEDSFSQPPATPSPSLRTTSTIERLSSLFL
jgi:hypothetical protein